MLFRSVLLTRWFLDAVSVFSNTLGGAISISIAENVFSNKLVTEVPKYTTGISGQTVLDIGATHIRDSVPSSQLAGVLQAYTVAIDTAFILPIAVGAAAFAISFLVSFCVKFFSLFRLMHRIPSG